VRAYIYVVPFYHSWKEVGKARGTRNSEHTMRVVPTLVDSRGDRRDRVYYPDAIDDIIMHEAAGATARIAPSILMQ